MLTEFTSKLKTDLLAKDKWHPFPTRAEREAWTALPADAREAKIALGEALLDYDWPSLPATLFLEYARNGNRSNYEAVRYARRYALRDLVLAECMEGQGHFLDQIVNGIWLICEETYWGVPAHISAQKAGVGLPDVEEPTVDLFAAETVMLLAWTLYLLEESLDTVSPLVRPRILYESRRRVLDPCLERDDFWWMGFLTAGHSVNNWNPWINSNWITAVLLLEEDVQRRVAALSKIFRSLDVFIDHYAEAGGCDEGPGYWGRAAASLFDCLELLYSATEGAIDVYDRPKIRNMGAFIYRTHIYDHFFVNFADASAINYPSVSLVFRYGRCTGDADMMAFGAWLYAYGAPDAKQRSDSIGRELPMLFTLDELLAISPKQPLPRDAWFDDIQVMVARDQGGSADGFFVAAKGGHNAESHNHNDVGNFIVYVDGKPVLVDAGVGTYTRKTFSPQRYEIWTMQSAYHSLLPTVDGVPFGNGVQQAPGHEFAARDVVYAADEDKAQFALDLAGAYPPEAHIASWKRALTLERGQAVQIEDTYVLTGPASIITLSLVSPCEIVQEQAGVLRFKATPFGQAYTSGEARVAYDAGIFTVAFETIPITDTRMGGVWGDHLNRVLLRAENPARQGKWKFRVTLV
ncbi:MAG: heparinase II/III family protein [Anaerolineae bacterium]|nr:heparinase II/III family protein [Anaerolineae bacterium]